MRLYGHLENARAELEKARAALVKEIMHYPTPIAGCDEQFNHLLSERNKVIEALKALDMETFVPTPRRLTA